MSAPVILSNAARGTTSALERCMILALTAVGLAVGAVGLLGFQLNRAPQGYEDKDGFHFLASTNEEPMRASATPSISVATSQA